MALTAEQLQDGTFRFHGHAVNNTKSKNLDLNPFRKQIMDQQVGNARFIRNDYPDKRIQMYKEEIYE